jgi:hypothetical protein
MKDIAFPISKIYLGRVVFTTSPKRVLHAGSFPVSDNLFHGVRDPLHITFYFTQARIQDYFPCEWGGGWIRLSKKKNPINAGLCGTNRYLYSDRYTKTISYYFYLHF